MFGILTIGGILIGSEGVRNKLPRQLGYHRKFRGSPTTRNEEETRVKIGVLTAPWADQPLEKVLDYLGELGVQAVEIGTGNYPPKGHCNPDVMLGDTVARQSFMDAIESRGMVLSALSCHGNPLHPNPAIAKAHHEVWYKTVRLANMLGVNRVITFSGCPGDDSVNARVPNWITAPWPPEHAELLEWQWEKKVIPYWSLEAGFAERNKVNICFEMHPNMVVYNPETLFRLRKMCGPRICCNFDPSHLWWQGMDPVEVVRLLGGDIIKHVHAKDVRIDAQVTAQIGVLDTKHYSNEIHRAWVFRTLGYGHSVSEWNDLISMLRLVGYDDVLSIEHEDSVMSAGEGLAKAVQFLKSCMITEPTGPMTWA